MLENIKRAIDNLPVLMLFYIPSQFAHGDQLGVLGGALLGAIWGFCFYHALLKKITNWVPRVVFCFGIAGSSFAYYHMMLLPANERWSWSLPAGETWLSYVWPWLLFLVSAFPVVWSLMYETQADLTRRIREQKLGLSRDNTYVPR